MCCFIKARQKLLDKNKFASSKIILRIYYSQMCNGKPTCSTSSTLTHTHTKSYKVLKGEKNIRQMHASRKNSWRMNGLQKQKSCLQQITQPTLPPPSEVKWLCPKCVCTSFMKGTPPNPPPPPVVLGASPVSNHLVLSFCLFSYKKFNCSKSHLRPH